MSVCIVRMNSWNISVTSIITINKHCIFDIIDLDCSPLYTSALPFPISHQWSLTSVCIVHMNSLNISAKINMLNFITRKFKKYLCHLTLQSPLNLRTFTSHNLSVAFYIGEYWTSVVIGILLQSTAWCTGVKQHRPWLVLGWVTVVIFQSLLIVLRMRL